MKELLDRVDENDKVIGTTTKDEAHKLGYAHRVAAIFVFDNNRRLLVQLRKKDGLFDHSVGGHITAGETYDQAAVRELQEELGLVVPLEKVGIFYADERVPSRELQVVHYFGLYEITLGDELLKKMVLSADEVIKMIPMTIEEIVHSMMNEPMKWTTGFKCTLNFYAKKKNLAIPIIPLS